MLAGLGQRRRRASAPLAAAALAGLVVALTSGVAFAGAQVTIGGTPQNNKAVTVSGSGFPAITKDPTGVQIIECSDPKGTTANLPTSAANCDGATQNPLPVNQDAQGNFTTQYTFQSLTGVHGTSNVPCDATHYCVLWVGVDYNQAFSSGPHAFSKAFEIEPASTGPTSTVTTTSPSVGASSPTTAPGNATPAAATAGAGTTPGDGGASLASTGVPASLPWVVAGGLALTLFGGLGRRLAGRGLPDRGI